MNATLCKLNAKDSGILVLMRKEEEQSKDAGVVNDGRRNNDCRSEA